MQQRWRVLPVDTSRFDVRTTLRSTVSSSGVAFSAANWLLQRLCYALLCAWKIRVLSSIAALPTAAYTDDRYNSVVKSHC